MKVALGLKLDVMASEAPFIRYYAMSISTVTVMQILPRAVPQYCEHKV